MKTKILLTTLIIAICFILPLRAGISADVARRCREIAEKIESPPHKAANQLKIALEEMFGRAKDAEITVRREACADYLTKLDEIDISDCPDAFKVAFNSHVDATRAFLKYLRNTPGDGAEFLFDALGRAMENKPAIEPEGNRLEKRDDALRGFTRSLSSISSTLQKLDAAAYKQGHPLSLDDDRRETQIRKLMGESEPTGPTWAPEPKP